MMQFAPRQSPSAADLPKELVKLGEAIQSLPTSHRGDLGSLFEKVLESTHRRRRILSLVQEALSQLRLDMKYLVFDLEATRRERDSLRNKNSAD